MDAAVSFLLWSVEKGKSLSSSCWNTRILLPHNSTPQFYPTPHCICPRPLLFTPLSPSSDRPDAALLVICHQLARRHALRPLPSLARSCRGQVVAPQVYSDCDCSCREGTSSRVKSAAVNERARPVSVTRLFLTVRVL